MATRTFLQLAQAVGDNLELRRSGTLTARASDGTTVTAATYPYRSSRANASNEDYEGVEIHITGGTAPVPNPNGVSAYVASTGVFTLSNAYTTNPDANATFDLYLRGVSIIDIRNAINEALRKLQYPTIVPLTLVTDGDMDTAGTSDWTATSATLSKVTNTNAIRGSQSQRVLATAASGNAQSATILVDPSQDRITYYVEARVRAQVGTARLIAYDVTNSANIETQDWTSRGWGKVGFSFTLPATCEALAIRLMSVANADDSYWDDINLFREGAKEIVLPSWIIESGQVKKIGYMPQLGGSNGEAPDIDLLRSVSWMDILPDYSNPNNQYRLMLGYPMTSPLWIVGTRYFAALSADADTTFADRTLIETYACYELLSRLQNRWPSQETVAWRQERATWKRHLAVLLTNPSYGLEPVVRGQLSHPY